ncbi:response regulator [Pseudomonas sp. AIG]
MDELEFDQLGLKMGPLAFAAHGGQVATFLRDPAFGTLTLGNPAEWTPGLKTLMSTILPVESQIVVFWGPEYVALYNDAYAPTIGDKHPAALGRPGIEYWSELWHDLEPLLRGVRDTGKTFSAKDRPFYLERHGRGEHVNFDISYSAVSETDGTVGGVLCIVTETTERVQFERLQAVLLDLGRAMHGANDPEAIISILFDRLAAELNPSRMLIAQKQLSQAAFEIIYKHVSDSAASAADEINLGPESLNVLGRGDAVIFGQGKDPQFKRVHWVVDDQIGVNERLCVPLLDQGKLAAVFILDASQQNGFSGHAVSIAFEATTLAWMWAKHASSEMAFRRSSAQISAMFDQAKVGIAICSPTGVFERVNDRYCNLVGRGRDDLLGFNQSRLGLGVERDFDARLPQLAPHDFVSSLGEPGVSETWVHHHLTTINETGDSLAGSLYVSVDITDRVKAEEELRAINSSLEARVAEMITQREKASTQLHEARKMEMVGQLSGGIAHDFNNLLTPIIASMELLQRRPNRARAPLLIDAALQAAERARLLVGKLLSFARRQTLTAEVVDLRALLDDMRDLLQRSLTPLHQVVMNIDSELPTVLIDPRQLELSILNLAVNARDAMEKGGRLEIHAFPEQLLADALLAQPAGEYVCLQVRDFGSGMSDDVLRRCVEPFFSTKGIGKGTGLGLSMVQGLALQSEGRFSISSKEGDGTVVSLWLPVAGCELKQKKTVEPGDLLLAPFAAQILLVDDDHAVRFTTALLLRELGYEVVEMSSGESALKAVKSGFTPHLLISDQMMPGKTGIELSQELRTQFPSLPVLIITGYTHPSQEHFGDVKVLPKPFHNQDLASTVFEMLKVSN